MLDAGDELSRRLLDIVPLGVFVWKLREFEDEQSLTLEYANPMASELTGIDCTSRLGETLLELFPLAPPHQVAAIAQACREGRATDFGRYTYRRSELSPSRKLSSVVRPFGPDRAAVLVQNVAELDRAELEARQVGRFVDSIIEHLPAMVFVKDAHNLRFQRFNRAGEDLLGLARDDLLGKNDYDFFPREQADFFVTSDREVLATRTLKEIRGEPIATPSGTRWLHTRKIPIFDEGGEPQYLLGVSMDITDQMRAEEVLRSSHEALEQRVRERTAELERQIHERERAEKALASTEEQLRQAQKMEAIGRLAGGVAHDFNNLLSVVIGYSDLMLRLLPSDARMRPHVEQISQAGGRAAELTRQLLAFSRRQVLSSRTVDLNDIVLGLEKMLARLLGEDVELHIHCHAKRGLILADPSQIEQVIMNLAVNARDAMPLGGTLVIETSDVVLDSEFVAQHLGTVEGPHVMLAVSDTGIGMDKETLGRVFEPFFTTKELGRGTGLGLSTVFGIVRQSGGVVWAYSEPGQGATFKVYLPLSARPAEAQTQTKEPVNLRGDETILLVEDDMQVRAFAATCLRELGYRVLEAQTPADALAQARAYRAPIHLLLTDVVMPGMGGRALAEQLLANNPELRVLFMSGYTDDAVVRHGVLESNVAFLQKPLTPSLLARRTREVLGGQVETSEA